MSIELPPLPHCHSREIPEFQLAVATSDHYAYKFAVEARERILTERIAELEAACIAAEAALTGLDFDYDGTKDACEKVTRALRGGYE